MLIKNSIQKILNNNSSSGIILIIITAISLLLANFSEAYYGFGNTEISIGLMKKSILHWTNDALMCLFFLLVGLEIRKELYFGELNSLKKASLPALAAIGGVIFPALIFVALNWGGENIKAWAIPCATDIAFSLAVLSILGSRANKSMKTFLSALAIIDDLIAILIIALFYSANLQVNYLLLALIPVGLGLIFRKYKINSLIIYISLGIALWYFIYASGIHATIAGVVLAFILPDKLVDKFEHSLYKPVNFIILPIFAALNTAILINAESFQVLTKPLGLGIVFGLLLGKPLGIFIFTKLAVVTGISDLPKSINNNKLLVLGFAAGIGFTMSIFISTLSFTDKSNVDAGIISAIAASIISGIVSIVLSFVKKKRSN
jgi:NhaA family Na+:H+ antiporter